jgi:hypothetical protein
VRIGVSVVALTGRQSAVPGHVQPEWRRIADSPGAVDLQAVTGRTGPLHGTPGRR